MQASNNPLLTNSFLLKERTKGVGTGEFVLLSRSNGISFFVLETKPDSQIVWQYFLDNRPPRIFKTFPVHPYIVAATVSLNNDFIILTYYSIHNGFTNQSLYYAILYSINTNFQHPVINISQSFPLIYFGETPNKFYYFYSSNFETWEIQQTPDDFILKRILRNQQNIIWFATNNENKLEYASFNAENSKLSLFLSNDLNFSIPAPKLGNINTFKHFHAHKSQDVVMYSNGSMIDILFPRSMRKLVWNVISNQNHPNGKKMSETTLWKFCALENDLLFLLTKSPQNDYILFLILVDHLGIPRSLSTALLPQDCMERNFLNISDNSISSIDINDGSFKDFDFDYENFIKFLPETFQPLLHYSTLKSGKATKIFSFVTKDVLQEHWSRPIFDEYYISMLSREDCNTFCQISQALLMTFTKFRLEGIEKCSPTPYSNLGQYLKGKDIPEISEIEPPYKDVPEDLQFFSLIQYFTDKLWISENSKIPEDFLKHVYPKLSPTVSESWVSREIAPYELIIDKDNKIELDWWSWRSNRREIVLEFGTSWMNLKENVFTFAAPDGYANEELIDFYSHLF